MGMQIGVLQVRRSVFIKATPQRVWREFSTFEAISNWLDQGHSLHKFEPKVGGTVEMSVQIGGEDRYYGGRVIVYEVDREVSFESQWQPPYSWPVPTYWTIRLSPVYGSTLVELFHHGFERLGDQAADNLLGYEEGWDVRHLKTLRSIVES